MSQTLFTNIKHSFNHEFIAKLKKSNELIIASGYFGTSAVEEYQKDMLMLGKGGVCKILIGMIFHGGITAKQQNALMVLDAALRATNPDNGVYISIKDYHGKIYLFRNKTDNAASLYLGSSNFSQQGFASRHECTALIQHEQTKKEVVAYLDVLFSKELAQPLSKVELRIIERTAVDMPPVSKLLEDYEISFAEYPDISTALGVCEIELRVDKQPNSSLNLYFDKGRVNPKTKLYAPRPWYEVEITSCKKDRDNPFYPKSELNSVSGNARHGKFIAYAEDDGKYYKFIMGVYSDYGKAIATHEDSGGRMTLGKLIKGKLERAGLLTEGSRITADTLLDYGKSSIDFFKLTDDVYIIKF
ncbi:MAG: NgoFVII family restriction endonuclease [Sulfuriferula sp.]|nr:NgoFVII family restriction endonuclease [Sulfuriferula sp.]